MPNPENILNRILADQDANEQTFQGVPVSQIANYQPWMSNPKIKDIYQIEEKNGEKRVIMTGEIPFDKLGVFSKSETNGQQLRTLNPDNLQNIFSIANARRNAEADQLGLKKVETSGSYVGVDLTNLRIDRKAVEDYVASVLDPDFDTSKLKTPETENKKAVDMFSNNWMSNLGVIGQWAGHLIGGDYEGQYTSAVSNSIWDTVKESKRAEVGYYLSGGGKITPATKEEVESLKQEFKQDPLYQKMVKDIESKGVQFKPSKGTIDELVDTSLKDILSDVGAIPKEYPAEKLGLMASVALNEKGFGKYAQIAKGEDVNRLEGLTNVTPFTGYYSVEGTPAYDPKTGKYTLYADDGNYEIDPENMSPDLDSLSKSNGELIYNNRNVFEVGKYRGKVNIGIGALRKVRYDSYGNATYE